MEQPDLFETEVARSLLDQLLADSKLYRNSRDYRDLLDFVVRLRNFAPFNAMLLQLQKPGLQYAASARDWRDRFGREVKERARPLLILWPFGPVGLVYDVMDTDGDPLPEDVSAFPAEGAMTAVRIAAMIDQLASLGIACTAIDGGDGQAGSIRLTRRAGKESDSNDYGVDVNRNHSPPTQFATIAHELGHLFLGHLGRDGGRRVQARLSLTHAQRELEAESVSYIVCSRNGIRSKSQSYLADYVRHNTTVDSLDFYQVMRAAGQVESALGVATHVRFEASSARPRGPRPRTASSTRS